MTKKSPSASPTHELLKRLMAEGMTQTEIAKKTGIPQPRISRWAAGDIPRGADDALKLQSLVNEYDKKLKNRRSSDKLINRNGK